MKNAISEHAKSNAPVVSGIVERSPSELKAWTNNPRIHSAKQLAKLKASIQKFGFTAPVLVDEADVILSGHCRSQAAKELGLATIPTRVIAGLSAAKKRAYVIADNKISQLSSWDLGLLKSEMELLIQDDFEIETTGFSTAEIDIMLDEGTMPTNEVCDLQPKDVCKDVVTKTGDLWQLGNHRLLCGDALSANCYQAIMQGEMAQQVISDVPYNSVISKVSGNGKIKHAEFAMASGEMNSAEFTKFLNTAFSHMHAFASEGAITFLFIDWKHVPELQDAAIPLFGPPRQLCVWVKDNGGMGTFYRSQHELVFAFKKGNVPHINNFELGQHGRYRTNVWNYPGANTFGGEGHELLALHPTIKPVSLIADAIRDCTHRKGIVLDPFAGSGTILIAAERTGRYARAIELEPRYVDISIMRWQRVTGKQAVLAATGKSWQQVRLERAANS